jgi:hypothetical protein
MENPKLIPVCLVFVFVLTACQLFSSGTAPATQVPTAGTPAVTTTAEAYPSPENGAAATLAAASNAYPGSKMQLTPLASDAYPEMGATSPSAAAQSAYPSPGVQPMNAQTEPVYPELKDGAGVAWSQVKDILFSGQVTQVGQTHDLNVTIKLKDGRTFKTVEPVIDDIIKLVQSCGDLCKDIKVATQ